MTSASTFDFAPSQVSTAKSNRRLFTQIWYNLLHQTAKCRAKKLFLVLAVCGFIGQTAVFGQSITPANDATGTVVNSQGNVINISGGQLSGDGANLFHSFQQFGLSENQTANFIANPALQNILGRVVGGDVSRIDGLLQVTGGNSNLFLMNPAGIIFGPNAQLNVPASFTAVTANSIGFGSNFFDAIGLNNYAALTGEPTSFVFSDILPGSIINEGNLAVNPGENLTLLGGTVINTGQVSAPGGQLNILQVPGQSVVRISQPGFLLSLEVSEEEFNSPSESDRQGEESPASLPEMLTGGDTANASDVEVNGDGEVELTAPAGRGLMPDNLAENNSEAVQIVGESLNAETDNLGGDSTFFNPNINAADYALLQSLSGDNTVLVVDDFQASNSLTPSAMLTDIEPDSNPNSQINLNAPTAPDPNNIQLLPPGGIDGNPPPADMTNNPQPPAEQNPTEMQGSLGENLPPDIPNIPSNVGDISGNFEALANINDLLSLDLNRADKYANYFGQSSTSPQLSSENIRGTLSKIASQTGTRSAIIYINLFAQQLELLLFLPDGGALRKTVPEANRESVLKLASEFRQEISNPRKHNTTSYLASARKLYSLLIAPLETQLQNQNINTLLFSLDTGLRSLPLAALHDGQQFLVEKYSLSQIPAFSLTDTRYQSIQNASVLAMGADTFNQLDPLPAVPAELSTIVDLWQGKSFLNEQFTLKNLQAQRSKSPYQIIHLATHGEFKAGAASDSFIQLWDGKLHLNQLRQLGWNNPPVELLVLSACRTALGDEQTELGFAGLAFQAGVKSALASLWYVSDEGTLALMSEFYHQLKTAPIKAEALRAAQIAMIKGQVRIEGGVLRGPFVSAKRGGQNSRQAVAPTLGGGNSNLAHPYFWAAFTMIGSPW